MGSGITTSLGGGGSSQTGMGVSLTLSEPRHGPVPQTLSYLITTGARLLGQPYKTPWN